MTQQIENKWHQFIVMDITVAIGNSISKPK